MKHQKKINACHNCANRVGCTEKGNPCEIYKKEEKKEKKIVADERMSKH